MHVSPVLVLMYIQEKQETARARAAVHSQLRKIPQTSSLFTFRGHIYGERRHEEGMAFDKSGGKSWKSALLSLLQKEKVSHNSALPRQTTTIFFREKAGGKKAREMSRLERIHGFCDLECVSGFVRPEDCLREMEGTKKMRMRMDGQR